MYIPVNIYLNDISNFQEENIINVRMYIMVTTMPMMSRNFVTMDICDVTSQVPGITPLQDQLNSRSQRRNMVV